MLLQLNSFMIATALATGLFGLIFLYLSHHMERQYMRFWGVALLGYTWVFLLDFLFIKNHDNFIIYPMVRMTISFASAVFFLYGTCDFFRIKVPVIIRNCIYVVLLLMVAAFIYNPLYLVLQIPMIIFLSLSLVSSGMMFMLYSWTVEMSEKYMTGFTVTFWSIYSCILPYTIKYALLATINYTVGLCLLVTMVLLLMILHFKVEKLKLVYQEKHFRMLVENASGAILLYDYNDRIFKYVSPTIDGFMAYDHDELLKNPDVLFEGMNKDGIKNMKKLLAKPLEGNTNFIFSRKNAKGDTKWYELYATPVYDPSLLKKHVEFVISDITLRMETINNLRLSEKSRKELIEDISHELRTPLTLIQGYSEILLKNDELMKDKSYLEIIRSKSISMNLLIDDLIRGSEFRSQNVEYVYYEVNARDFLAQPLREYEWLLKQGGRKVACKNIDDKNCMIIIDEDRIKQVLDNVINNALKFTLPGDEVNIMCIAEKKNEENPTRGDLKISISDTGMGVRNTNVKELFKRKFRGRIEKNYSNDGSGLGLYISNEIIGQHGGEIWAEDNKPKGTVFHFTVPCTFNTSCNTNN